MKILLDALDREADKCNYFCYVHTKGFAPQFYLREKELGNYIKITLNEEGTIHTIYEDVKKELLDENIIGQAKTKAE